MKNQLIILAIFLTACIGIGFLVSKKVKLENDLKSLKVENSTAQERIIELENENQTLGAISQRVDTVCSTDTVYYVEYVNLIDSFKYRTGMALRLLHDYKNRTLTSPQK